MTLTGFNHVMSLPLSLPLRCVHAAAEHASFRCVITHNSHFRMWNSLASSQGATAQTSHESILGLAYHRM